jgi:hypothetical protein
MFQNKWYFSQKVEISQIIRPIFFTSKKRLNMKENNITKILLKICIGSLNLFRQL